MGNPLAPRGPGFYTSAVAPPRRPYAIPHQDRPRPLYRHAECVGIAPEVFQLGDDNVSLVLDSDAADDAAVLDGARACRVDAITLIDEFEEQVWPA